MYSIAFPDILTNTNVKLFKDHEATAANLKLMILSNKKGLLGDPYFGTNLQNLLFEQNNQVIKDLIIDEIYVAILNFMPQLLVKREDITITHDLAQVYVNINALNFLDYTTNLYNINITSNEEI